MLDVFLQPEYSHHWADIVNIAKLPEKEARTKLRPYVLEACRLSSQSFGLFRRVQEACTIDEGGVTHHLNPGDEVFANLVLPSPTSR